MCSSDFAEPLTLPSMMDSGPSTSDSVMGATPLDPNSPPEESVAILTSMGFPRTHSINALKATVSLPAAVFSSSLRLGRFEFRRCSACCAAGVPGLFAFDHLPSCDQAGHVHNQAGRWNEARGCKQRWWRPSCCHKSAWLAHMLTLQKVLWQADLKMSALDAVYKQSLRHVRSSACQVQETRFVQVSRQTVRKNKFWCEAKKRQLQGPVLVWNGCCFSSSMFHVSDCPHQQKQTSRHLFMSRNRHQVFVFTNRRAPRPEHRGMNTHDALRACVCVCVCHVWFVSSPTLATTASF